MAPELLYDLDENGQAIYDNRVDVFALAVMMKLSWDNFVDEKMG